MNNQIISRNPQIMSGELVFTGTRVPVYILIDYLESGNGLDEFLDDYPTVTREKAVAAIRLAGEALREQYSEVAVRRESAETAR